MIKKKISIEKKNSLSIKKIKNILLSKEKNLPFDGYATKYRNVKVKDFFIKNNKSLNEKEQKDLFKKENFPLIDVISNRKALNLNSNLIKNLLHEETFVQPKIFNYNHPKIGLFKPLNDNKIFFYEKKRERAFNKVKNCLTINSNNSISKENNLNKNIKKEYNFNIRYNRNLYMREHLTHSLNIEFLKNKDDENYVRFAYKKKLRDKLINNVKKELMTIKYNNHIHLLNSTII